MLEWKIKFLDEKRTETYVRYVEGSIADKNLILRQAHCGETSFAGWQADAA